MKIHAPVCAVCGCQVDQFEQVSDVALKVERFTARCHGATQTVEITYMEMAMMGPDGISMKRAFEFPALEVENG